MDAPSSQDVERQLRLVLAASEFEASPKLSELLYYLVTQVLAGNADRLKGYTIGVDVFDRNPDFDQGLDAIVRVQMGRLRKLLDTYYRGSGKHDPIRISLVPGRYVPRFDLASGEDMPDVLAPRTGADDPRGPGETRADAEPLDAATASHGLLGRLSKSLWLAVGALLLILLAGLTVQLFGWDSQVLRAPEAVRPQGPLVHVSRYQVIGERERERQLADGLQYDLVNQLAKFPEIEVLAAGQDNAVGNAPDGQGAAKADFLLTGAIEAAGGSLRVTSQLRRARDGLVIWSDQWLSEQPQALTVIDLQTMIATSVATKVGQPYGVIPQAMSEEIAEGHQSATSEYACVLSTYTYMRHKTPEQHGKVRDCLERALTDSPRHALVWALAAWIYGDEERYGFNRKPDAIGRALRAAERGVAADSHNAVAYEHLAHARFLTGTDDASAREALETALNLNPNNSEVLADASWMLALMGELGRAATLGRKAIEVNPGHPAWYWTGPTIAALLTGDRPNALEFARLNISDRGPIDIYLYAAALRLNGQGAQADAEIRQLASSHPDIGDRAHMMQILRIPPRLELLIFGTPRGR